MTQENDQNRVISQARQICHDINQPLTVIMARSELLLMKMSQEDPTRRSLEQIHQQAEKISNLISDLRLALKGAFLE